MNIKGAEECIKMGPTHESSRTWAGWSVFGGSRFNSLADKYHGSTMDRPNGNFDVRHKVVLRGCLIGWTIADVP